MVALALQIFLGTVPVALIIFGVINERQKAESEN